MLSRSLAGALVGCCLLAGTSTAVFADDATMFRVFLKDGTSLVSYGEFARVGDRLVFSMPTSAVPNPPLHLVNLEAARVDWDRTNRYAASARAAHYVQSQADNDYSVLSNQVAESLNEVAVTTDPTKRLAIVERARKMLSDWPASHYNFRLTEIQQMLGMLDEAIADLRASAGSRRFDLSLSTYTDPNTIVEPLLSSPTPKAAIEQTLLAAQLADTPEDRTSLLSAALVGLDESASELPAEWVSATRAETKARIQTEVRLDRQYQALTKRMLLLAHQRAELADVKGIEGLVKHIHWRDTALGAERPTTVTALLASVQHELDAARKLRLARDRWALRAPDMRRYRAAIAPTVARLALLTPPLEGIKALSGSTPEALAAIHRLAGEMVQGISTVVPPEELKGAHALLLSAAQLADNAARIRGDATLADDMARAWDASSAAAGALMLGTQARSQIRLQLAPPKLR